MDQLNSAVKLSEKIEIVIPGTMEGNKKTDTQKYKDRAVILLAELFGGSTALKASGAYVSDNHGLIKEDVYKVYSYAVKIDAVKLAIVLKFIDQVKEELKQECIGLEINGAFYLV